MPTTLLSTFTLTEVSIMALTLLEASKHAQSPEELAIIRELSGGDLLSVYALPEHHRIRSFLEA